MKYKKQSKESVRKVMVVLFAVFLLGIFCILLNQKPWYGQSIRNINGTVAYTENPWTLEQGGTVIDPDLELPQFIRLEEKKIYTISTRLTYDGTKDKTPYAFLHLDHMYCRVKLDGQVLFSHMPEDVKKRDAAKSPGFIYKAFPLPFDCKGKKMEIEMLPMFTTTTEYGLPELKFGDLITMYEKQMLYDMPQNIVVALCILLGIVAILFSTTSLRGSNYHEGLTIGIFSLLFALYLITESKINVYYIGNPYYTYILNYITFSLLPVSLMGFMRERLMEKQKKACTVVIAGELILFGIEMILHFCGILDMREIVHIIHFIYFAEIALVVICILRMGDKKKKHSLVLQLTPVMIGMSLDVVIYWQHWEIGGNDATFTILGVIIFLIVELLHVWKTSVTIYTQSVRSAIYHQMAYTDEMTGAGNRRAYEMEIEEILKKRKTYESMMVVSADVNELKYVNDTFGHIEGDKLIRGAAQIMLETVGKKGKVFRTGGDEFIIFLYNTGNKEYEAMLEAAIKEKELFDENHRCTMSVAVGGVRIWGNNILDAVKEADKKMYIEKARHKRAAKAQKTEERQ